MKRIITLYTGDVERRGHNKFTEYIYEIESDSEETLLKVTDTLHNIVNVFRDSQIFEENENILFSISNMIYISETIDINIHILVKTILENTAIDKRDISSYLDNPFYDDDSEYETGYTFYASDYINLLIALLRLKTQDLIYTLAFIQPIVFHTGGYNFYE